MTCALKSQRRSLPFVLVHRSAPFLFDITSFRFTDCPASKHSTGITYNGYLQDNLRYLSLWDYQIRNH